jgi:hypothetical protein
MRKMIFLGVITMTRGLHLVRLKKRGKNNAEV